LRKEKLNLGDSTQLIKKWNKYPRILSTDVTRHLTN
jgi:hypothetical protein